MKEAIVLSGGLGTRLRAEIGEYPKPMASVAKKPFLEYILTQLQYHRFQRVVLAVGYKYEFIQEYFGNEFKNMDLIYSIEKEKLGTGGAIRFAIEKCNSKNVLVCNGDSFFNINISEFINSSNKRSFDCTIALNKLKNTDRYGLVNIDKDNKIIGFQEKKYQVEALINSGIYYLNKESFLEKMTNKKFSMEKDYFEKHVKNEILGGFIFEGFFRDIGIPEDFNKAQNEFKTISYR